MKRKAASTPLSNETPSTTQANSAESETPPSSSDWVGEEVHARARRVWGRDAQLIALAEELSEAAASVCRFLNGKGTLEEVREELVDVDSLKLSLRSDLGTHEEWTLMTQEKRAKLLAKLDGGVRRV